MPARRPRRKKDQPEAPKLRPSIGTFEGKNVVDLRAKVTAATDAVMARLENESPDGFIEHAGSVGYAIVSYTIAGVDFPVRKARDPDGNVEHDRKQTYAIGVWIPIDRTSASTAIDEYEAAATRRAIAREAGQPEDAPNIFDLHPDALSSRVDSAFVGIEGEVDPACDVVNMAPVGEPDENGDYTNISDRRCELRMGHDGPHSWEVPTE